MNRLFYHMKKPSFLILSGMLMVSCTDGDFDLSHIDTTIGVGSEALQLPISNTNQITLDNILDIDGSDIIFKDEATGYYSLLIISSILTVATSFLRMRQRVTIPFSKKTIVSVLRRFLLISHHSLFLGNTTIS